MCPRHQTGFYFIFIPFHLWEWYDRRVFSDFWILNKLVMPGMAFQSSSVSRLCPQRSPARGFSENWNKLGWSGDKCQAIQDSLVLRGQIWGYAMWELELTQRPLFSECPTFIHFFGTNGTTVGEMERERQTLPWMKHSRVLVPTLILPMFLIPLKQLWNFWEIDHSPCSRNYLGVWINYIKKPTPLIYRAVVIN